MYALKKSLNGVFWGKFGRKATKVNFFLEKVFFLFFF
jgi:hypothetical protein